MSQSSSAQPGGPAPYSDGMEQIAEDEQETFDKIVASMTRESEAVQKRHGGHAVRASHAKSTGQDAYSPARQAYCDESLSFQPAHGLAAHRPLGSIMRARLKAYQALSDFRHRQNGQAQHEPRTPEEVPD